MWGLGGILSALLTALLPVAVLAQEPWPLELVDPAGADGSPADLLLPMPCGAAMAFQRVLVPTDPADPLADLLVWIGQDGTENGYIEARRAEYLRGPFDAGAEGTAYFIARYELTEGQYRALNGDCSATTRKDRIARGNVTWLEAQQLADTYSRWIHETAEPAMPRRGMAQGFVRLPTETEWEYATRGGAAVDAERFAALHFFSAGSLEDYAIFVAPGSSRGKVTAVGLKQPNPLGLYDVYGNVEELMLEPYRLTLPGRMLGQPGGVVTRGGSAISQASQIYSAQRTEYTPYSNSGSNTNAGIGVRFVLSAHLFSSDLFLDTVKSSWSAAAAAASAAPQDVAIAPDQPLTAVVQADHLASAMTEADAVHLLSRTGFGAHPDEIAAMVGLTRRDAISAIVSGFRTVAQTTVPFSEGPVPAHWLADDLFPSQRAVFMKDRRVEADQLEDWWLAEMASTPSPQTERMVLFWHNVLGNSFSSVNGEVVSLARNNRTLRAKGAGDLRGLLTALLSDAATLRTHKAGVNGKLSPDPTFAAFLLSLSGEPEPQEDVAKVLTGLGINSIAGLKARYDAWRAEDTQVSLFGQPVTNPQEVVDAIAAYPGTAEVMARRVWQEYIGPDLPPSDVIMAIAANYMADAQRFTALLQATLERPEFWADDARGGLVRKPVDLIVSAVRSSGLPVADVAHLRKAIVDLGQEDTPDSRARIMKSLFLGGGIKSVEPAPEGPPDRVYVRYAAEDFIGPPDLTVTLYRNGTVSNFVWQTEQVPASGGVDTAQYPRGNGTQRWQIASFAIPQDVDFDLIGVGFSNDRCCEALGGKTGDRNLFIDWMQIGDRRYSAKGAEIKGRCNNGPQQNGELFCTGKVMFERGTKVRVPDAPTLAKFPKSRLVVERSVALWMNFLAEDTPLGEAAFALSQVRFDDFAAQTLGVRIRWRRGAMPELVLDPTLCSPACLPGDWPVPTTTDGPGVLVLPLSTTGADGKVYEGLSDKQRRVIAAIWMSLPDLVAESAKGKNAVSSALQRRLPIWHARLEKVWPTIAASPHAKLVRAPAFLVMPLHDGPFAAPRVFTAVSRPAGQEPVQEAARVEQGIKAVTNAAFSYR